MRYLLIGGTGTLGAALVARLVAKHEVIVFSRGELAQKDLAAKFPTVRMVLGDVRDQAAVTGAFQRYLPDVVFLLAAIKHVDMAETNPLEAIKTNVMGAVNVAAAAHAFPPGRVVYSNTDKAVLPITTYGYTKAIAQNYLLAQNVIGSRTRYSAFNWGNIIASRGSVIQTFVDCLARGEDVPVTDPRMSRFWLTIDAAADFMLANFHGAPVDSAMIPPIRGAPVINVIASIARIVGVKNYNLRTTGLRGTEKIHEVLMSTHEGCLRSDNCEQFTDEELDETLRPIVLRLLNDKGFDWNSGKVGLDQAAAKGVRADRQQDDARPRDRRLREGRVVPA